jgi:hypothetical protein
MWNLVAMRQNKMIQLFLIKAGGGEYGGDDERLLSFSPIPKPWSGYGWRQVFK